MRRFFVVFLLSLVMLTACTQKTETPEQTLEAFLSHMQKGEYAKADEYIHNPSEEKLTQDLEGFSTDSEFVRILRTYITYCANIFGVIKIAFSIYLFELQTLIIINIIY